MLRKIQLIMNKNFIIIAVLILSILTNKSIAQNNKLSIDANYSMLVGDNFLKKNYNGLIDIGVQYYIKQETKLNIGVSNNIELLGGNYATLVYKPRFFIDKKMNKINPYLGIGYSILYYFVDNQEYPNQDKTSDGININLGCKAFVSEKIYLNVSYDFIKLRAEDAINNSYNTNIQMVSLGLGYKY
jgi:outer membrane protein W